jgi:hypothetical protein
MVAEASAGAVTVVGLTEHVGGSIVPTVVEVTTQLRVTVPVKPLSAPTVMFEDAVPPGATASGENAAACNVKFCAVAADGSTRKAVHRHRAMMPAQRVRSADDDRAGPVFWDLNFNGLELNMSRFRFK